MYALLSGRTCDTALDGFRTASEVLVKREAPAGLTPAALATAVSELLGVLRRLTVVVTDNTQGRRSSRVPQTVGSRVLYSRFSTVTPGGRPAAGRNGSDVVLVLEAWREGS